MFVLFIYDMIKCNSDANATKTLWEIIRDAS